MKSEVIVDANLICEYEFAIEVDNERMEIPHELKNTVRGLIYCYLKVTYRSVNNPIIHAPLRIHHPTRTNCDIHDATDAPSPINCEHTTQQAQTVTVNGKVISYFLYFDVTYDDDFYKCMECDERHNTDWLNNAVYNRIIDHFLEHDNSNE